MKAYGYCGIRDVLLADVSDTVRGELYGSSSSIWFTNTVVGRELLGHYDQGNLRLAIL